MVANCTPPHNPCPTAMRSLTRLALAFVLAGLASLSLLLLMQAPRPHPVSAAGTIRYAAPGGNCGSAVPCYSGVQAAVDAAATDDEIRVAAGTYAGVTFNATSVTTQTVYLNKTLTLRGGYTLTNWLTPDPYLYPTILDADSQGRVIYIDTVSPTIAGFEIRRGHSLGESGGGIYTKGGNPTIQSNKIYSNTATNHGAGVYNIDGSPRMERNLIYSNTATNYGGGFYSESGFPYTQNNIFYSNQANAGGGLANGNLSTLTVQNDTFYQNTALGGTGGGLVNGSKTITVVNTIVFSNTAGTGGGIGNFGTANIDYNNVVSNTGGDYGGVITPGLNSIAADPLFEDAGSGNFHLTTGSPAKNAGTPIAAVTDDFEGNGRPFGSGYDIGADEYYESGACYARLDNGRVYPDLQTPADAASSGSLIQIAGYCAGVDTRAGLTQTLYLSQSLTVQGGYTVTDWTNPNYGPTILDAQGQGRVLYLTGTGPITLQNLHVTGGYIGGTEDGGGLYLGDNVEATLQNNVIYQNEAADNGGGLYIASDSPTQLQHNTIYSNTAADFGGGIYAANAGGSIALQNTLVVSNEAGTNGGGVYDVTSSNVSLSYNDFYGNTPDNYGGVTTGTTDISAAPGFADPAGNDFHLDFTTSSVIDAAPDILDTDFEGQARPQGERSDTGADESIYYAAVELGESADSPVIVTDVVSIEGDPFTFTHTITDTGNTGDATDTFDISISNSDGWSVSPTNLTLELTPGVPVSFDVVVTANSSLPAGIFNRTIITATYQANPAVVDTVEDIIANPGVELVPNYSENADPGEILTYTHTLTNTGPTTDTFDISYFSPFGWTEEVTPASVTVGPGESTLVLARVRVTDTAPANLADVVTITAQSLTYLDISAGVTDTTTANATTGDRFVAVAGNNANNNCTQESTPCAAISYAVNQAAFSDTVFLAQGTYNDAGLNISLNINLRGGYIFDGSSFSLPGGGIDPALTVIDAQNNGRGLSIQVVPAFQPEIEGFTIANASTSGVGGGIYVQSSSAPRLSNLIIQDSSASRGGGVYIDRGNPVLANVRINGAQAGDHGGGIYINSGSPLIYDVTISDTVAGNSGGGLYLQSGSPTITSSTIYNAEAATGGGLFNNSGSLTAQKLEIESNSATTQGGGLYNATGTIVLSQTRVSHNTAATGGGSHNAGGSLTLWNNFIYSNTSTTGAGGGVNNYGTLALVNNTLHGNQSAGFGGGIYDDNTAGLVVSNTIIVANSAITGGGLYRSDGGSTPASLDYNDVWGNTAPSSADSNVATGPNSISADPLFTDAATGDFHLAIDSPAVDTADPDTFLTADIEDDIRPINQGFDMGADEVSGCLARIERTAEVFGVLQDAIDAAEPSDLIQIAGICRGVQPRQVGSLTLSQTAIVSKNITLEGGYDSGFNPTVEETILDAEGLGRVVVITGSVSAKISNLTLTGGNAAGQGGKPGGGDAGGGLYNYNNILELVGATITNCQAAYGGGLFNIDGTLRLGGDGESEFLRVLSNTATYGGGLYLESGSALVFNTTIEQNSAGQSGGGIYNAGSTATISQTGLFSNTANTGGGLYANGGLVTGQVITTAYNTATTDGGGYYTGGSGQVSLERSLVLSNTAGANGSGFYNAAGGDLSLVNNMVAGNIATGGSGGGLYNLSENLTLRHNTFHANHAGSGQGGGIYHAANSATPLINSTLIANNTAGAGSGIYSPDTTKPAFDYNDVWNNNYGGTLGAGDGSGNISADPDFLSIDPADDNFLRISGGSPVEDKADPASPILIDIEEDPRPSNQGFDIGADEAGSCYVRINGNAPTYGNVQVAVGQSSNGDEIRVAGICQGVNPIVDGGQTVSQTVYLTKSLTIRGGYTQTNWIDSDPETNPTVLDALTLGRVVYITGTAEVEIAGLHLRYGEGVNGGAIFAGGDSVLTMTHNQVYSSTATNGGALYNESGTVYLHGNTQTGGVDNLIFGNSAVSGGAVYNAGGQLTLDDNILRANQATTGGAVYQTGGTAQLQNNILRENTATTGGAVYNNAGDLSVWHNTFYQNSAGGGSGDGAGFYTIPDTPDLRNNIFYSDSGSNIIYGPGSFTVNYNNVYPAGSPLDGGAQNGTGNLFAVDPDFESPGDDFHLKSTSPVIDRGDPAMSLFLDFEGDYRPSDQGFDMGADEQASCRARIVRTGEIYGNIQRAVDNSIPDDVIQVSMGTCGGVHPYLDGGQTLSQTVHITHNLTLHGGFSLDFSSGGEDGPFGFGSSDPTASTIDAMGLGRTVLVTNSAVITMRRFNLGNGDATGLGGGPGGGDAGGGIYYAGSRIRMEHVDFYYNSAGYGGAFYNAGDNVDMYNSWINENTASVDGGAIFNASGVITITGSPESTRVYSNTAVGRGGGIYNDTGEVRLLNNNSVELYSNQADQGGFIYNNTGQVRMENNVIFSNSANEGGAIYNNTGSMTLDLGNKLYDNDADQGGAIYHAGGDDLTVQNTFLYQNSGFDEGGALYIAGGNPDILHNTFYQNSGVQGSSRGGAVYIAGGDASIKNNIFDSNSVSNSDNGTAIYRSGGSPDLEPNDYWPTDAAGQVKGITVSGPNLNIDPSFADAGSGDFKLQAGSGLIDNSTAVDLGLLYDFENDPRPVNAHSEMGADEYNACVAQVAATGDIYGRIQTAIDEAPWGTEVKVMQGACYENISINKNLTLSGSWTDSSFQSQHDDIMTTINAQSTGERVVDVTDAATGTVSISWITLTRGDAGTGNGGGVRSQAGTLNMSNVEVISNTAQNGGGIYLQDGTATIAGTIEDNTANTNGGGMYVANGLTADISGEISNNEALGGDGGGLYNAAGSDVRIGESAVSGNAAGGDGGGLYNGPGSVVWTSGGIPISGNQAGGNGGGVYNDSANFELRQKQINSGEAQNGAGIYITGSGTVTLTNLGMYGNSTTASSPNGNGAGIYREGSGSVKVYHATLQYNDADNEGGGVYNAAGTTVISASIIAFNTSGVGGSGVHVDGGSVSIAYGLRSPDNTYSGVSLGTGNLTPADPHLRSTNGDIYFSSPAIDAVPTIASDVTIDRVGDTRPQMCAKDIGRDEFQSDVRELTWADLSPAEETVAPTESVTYTFVVSNTSENYTGGTSLGEGTGYTETITITLNSTQNWSEIVDITGGAAPTILPGGQEATVRLGPADLTGQFVTVVVSVTVPAGTFSDQVDSTTLAVEGYQCSEQTALSFDSSPAATTRVLESLSFVIAPDNSGGPVLPGETITYTHRVTNTGNITDSYIIAPGASLYAIGDVLTPSGYLIENLGPGESFTVTVSVAVDPEAGGGLTDVTGFIAQSNTDATQKAAADNTTISYTTGTRYVSLEGFDSLVGETPEKDNNCTQPDIEACRTVQQAIDQAAPDDAIKIDQGRYNVVYTDVLTITHQGQVITQVAFVDQPVSLQGGYDRTNWDESPPRSHRPPHHSRSGR